MRDDTGGGGISAAAATLGALYPARGERVSRIADRFIDSIEFLAALFVAVVAADVFVSILLRYFLGVSIPASSDFGRLLLGVLIFWGSGPTSYRGTHITVDLLLANVGPKY